MTVVGNQGAGSIIQTMKYKDKILILILLFHFITGNLKAQVFENKSFKVNGTGILKIPTFLDTTNQEVLKKSLTQRMLNNIDESGKIKFENDYQVNVINSFLSNYDSSTIMFWPTKALFSFVNSPLTKENNKENTSTSIPEDLSIIPNILLKRKEFKYRASQLKQALLTKDERNKLTNSVTEFYISLLKALLPSIVISDVSSKYFDYLNSYPTLNISISYKLANNGDGVSYKQDTYMMYMDYAINMFRFEYRNDETIKWQAFENYFFRQLKFL